MIERPPSLTLTLLKRELLTGLRSWKSFILLLALLAVLYGTAFTAMDAASENYVFMAAVMQSLFTMQAIAVGAIVFAVIPAMAAVSINGERQEENYDLLLTTLITPRRILLGKFAAVLIRALLVAIAVLPFTGLVYFYAGVDVESFFGALAILIPAALCNAAAGLWCSNLVLRPARSIFLTFGIIALMAGLIPVSAVLHYNVPFFKTVEPFASLGSFVFSHPVEAYILYQLAACALFLLDALVNLRRLLNPFRRFARGTAIAQDGSAIAAPRGLRVPAVTIPDRANPLGYKDLCGSALRFTPAAVAAFVLTAGAYGLLVAWILWEEAELLFAIGILERLFLLLLVPPMVAVLMVKEREAITFDMLRMTLLTPGSLVAGKLVVLLRLLKPVLIAILSCKTLVVLCVITLTDYPQFYTPGYVFVLDLALLPLHFLFVALAAMLGAAMPGKLTPAIGGASGFTLVATFVLIYAQFEVLADGTSSDVEYALEFLFSHVILIGFAWMIFLGLTMAIISGLWNKQSNVRSPPITRAPPLCPQPPSLPK